MKYIPVLLAEYITQGYNIKLINEMTYVWDYGLSYADGNRRFQYVYLGEMTERGKDHLFIRSLIADFSDKLNAMQLLREAEYGSLSCVCLKLYPKNGEQVEGVYVQTIFPAELAMQNKGVFIDLVHEVANRADAIEKKYLAIDN